MHAFQVGLHRGDDGAVDDADHREHRAGAARGRPTPAGTARTRTAGGRRRPSSGSRRPAPPSPRWAPRCARAGSQVWNGNSGALIANAAMNPRNNSTSVVPDEAVPSGEDPEVEGEHAGVGLVDERRARAIDARRNAEPAAVYRKNLVAAYSRRPLPHPRMRKYMGTSMSSQKTKNTIRSRARKIPMIAPSRSRNHAMYALTRCGDVLLGCERARAGTAAR